jgi:hypothetical protein
LIVSGASSLTSVSAWRPDRFDGELRSGADVLARLGG